MIEAKLDDRMGRVLGRGADADDRRAGLASAPPARSGSPRRRQRLCGSPEYERGRSAVGRALRRRRGADPLPGGDRRPVRLGQEFTLHRLVETIETLAAAAGRTSVTPFLSRVLVIPIDAAGVSGDPACAIASAAFAALERDRDGGGYAALADEAAHAGADPQRAAAAAADRHDEIGKRLESERAARDEVEAKRARLTEALLYETPGSRVDTFIRASRASIEARLRRFDLAEGDASTNYRDLVRDLDSVGVASRAGVAVRSIWAYRSQARWLVAGALAFALAFGLDQLRGAQATAWWRGLGAVFAPLADWLTAHDDALETAADAVIVFGLFAIFLNVWRTFGFTALLVSRPSTSQSGHARAPARTRRERRAAEQRVAALAAEAEAASQHAEATARRAGGGKPSGARARPALSARGPGPRRAARSFFAELGRLMSGPQKRDMPTPSASSSLSTISKCSRPPSRAIDPERVHAIFGPGCAARRLRPRGIVRADARGDAARQPYREVSPAAVAASDVWRLAAPHVRRRAASAPTPRQPRSPSCRASRSTEPLTPAEARWPTAIAPLAGGDAACDQAPPQRLSPRPALQGADVRGRADAGGPADPERRRPASACARRCSRRATDLAGSTGPAALVAAPRSPSRGAPTARFCLKSRARAAWDAARRYAPDRRLIRA